jgi:hypothetical protein
MALLGIPIYGLFLVIVPYALSWPVKHWWVLILLYPFIILLAWLSERKDRVWWREGMTWKESGEVDVKRPRKKRPKWEMPILYFGFVCLALAAGLEIFFSLTTRS